MGGGLLPKVVENMLDAKVELDGRLRTVINDFTSAWAIAVTAPINASETAKPRFDPLAAVAKVKDIAAKDVPMLRRKLDEYLDDVRVKETLVAAVQDQVLQNYETFYDLQTADKKGAAGKAGKNKKGKGREDEVWDLDMFTEWAVGVFGVRGFNASEGGDGELRGDSMSGGSRSV